MTETDTNYFRRRAVQAREQAERASDSVARQAHEFMAARYDQLSVGENPAELGRHIVDRG